MGLQIHGDFKNNKLVGWLHSPKEFDRLLRADTIEVYADASRKKRIYNLDEIPTNPDGTRKVYVQQYNAKWNRKPVLTGKDLFPEDFTDEDIAKIGRDMENMWDDLDDVYDGDGDLIENQRYHEYLHRNGRTYKIFGGKNSDGINPDIQTWFPMQVTH